MIGRIVDMNIEDFKKELVNQKISIGVLNNLKLNLTGAFNELLLRKESIVKSVTSGDIILDDETTKVMNGLYSEMMKIEEKVLHINEYAKSLIDVG